MKSMSLLAMAPLALLPSLATAGQPQVTLQSGGAALATYEQVSADGCVVTRGEIAVLDAFVGGELADGLYVTAMQENTCTGEGRGYAGYAGDGALGLFGLFFGRWTGLAEIPEYSGSGAAPLTVELDLRWFGQGPVDVQHDVFDDGVALSFALGATRAAVTSGTFTIDGEPATVTSATLGKQTSGQITK